MANLQDEKTLMLIGPSGWRQQSDYGRGFNDGVRAYRSATAWKEYPKGDLTQDYLEGRIDGYNWAYFARKQEERK